VVPRVTEEGTLDGPGHGTLARGVGGRDLRAGPQDGREADVVAADGDGDQIGAPAEGIELRRSCRRWWLPSK